MGTYNTTDLRPDTAFERHVFHRDQFAHYLRWSFVLNRLDLNQKVLDFGCGAGNLYEVLYRNRYAPQRFLGLDIREQTIEQNRVKFPKAEWQAVDLVGEVDVGTDWDHIVSFETIEHVNKKNGEKFVKNLWRHCNPNTIVYLSTQNYDHEVGAAANHTYDGQVQEYAHDELGALLEPSFTVIEKYGTFASKRDYFHLLSPEEQALWQRLHKYWDSNLMANIFAPLHPVEARNCLWVLKAKLPTH